MTDPDFVYTTYIQSTPQKVWNALTTPEFTLQYWGMELFSEWKKDAEWYSLRDENRNVEGKILESDPPHLLAMTWYEPSDKSDDSRVVFEIEELDGMVRLDVTHSGFKTGSSMLGRISSGWPIVLSSLKSFLETGKPIDISNFKKCGGSSKAA